MTPICTHIFEDQHRCGSPALRGEAFCYFHHPDRRPVANPYERRARRGFNIVLPQDAVSLQYGLNQVIDRLASNRIDVNRAKLLLYSFQMASRSIGP